MTSQDFHSTILSLSLSEDILFVDKNQENELNMI